MHTNSELKGGGDKINPSSRENIHNHPGCCFANYKEMGRYGYNSNRKSPECSKNSPQQNEGIDEVDNVISKFKMPQSSPLAVNNLLRSNSFRSPQPQYSDNDDEVDDDDDSIDEDDYNEWQIQTEHQTSKHSNNSSMLSSNFITPERNNSSRNHEKNISSYLHSPSQPRENRKKQCTEEKGGNLKHVLVVVAILGIATAIYCGGVFEGSTDTSYVRYNQLNFYKDINSLGGKYQLNDDAVLQVQSGISTIYNKQDTGSFIFIYDSETTLFDPQKFNNFMNDIALSAARYLRNDSASVRHVVIDSSKLDMNSHSDLIEKYRDDVTRKGVMLVKDINDVPPSLAMAFHYYCDEYNPLVKKSAIFFTLNTAKCTVADQTKNHAYIEKCLAKKWTGGVPQDNIRPLLTRIVNIVVDVTGRF